MKRTTTLECTVDLNEDKEYPGYMALHLGVRRITLYLKDGTKQDGAITLLDISEKELHEIKIMIDQSIELLRRLRKVDQ